MKKLLLLSVLSIFAGSAFAQLRSEIVCPNLLPASEEVATLAPEETAVAATATRVAKAPVLNAVPVANYFRPTGAFYGVMYNKADGSLSSYYAPNIVTRPYRPITFINSSTGATSYNWHYQLYDRTEKARLWHDVTDTDLTIPSMIIESDSVPTLTAIGDGGSSEFTLLGYKKSNGETTGTYSSMLQSMVNYETFNSSNEGCLQWLSPHYFAANSDRTGTQTSGRTYSTGGTPMEGYSKGYWFGPNATGIEGLCVAFEQPNEPYILRYVGVQYQGLKISGDDSVEFTVTVYRLADLPEYADTARRVVPLDTIAKGTFIANAQTKASGVMKFVLTEDFEGLDLDITPEIDCPILIEFSGYNNPALKEENGSCFTLLQSRDVQDDGHGEICYLKRKLASGDYAYIGLNHFFTSGERKSALSIYINTETPYLTFNYLSETGEYTFENQGETHEVDLYTYYGASEFIVTDADGNDLPDWLEVELAHRLDDNGDPKQHVVFATMTVAPLPEDTQYRECNVLFSTLGARLAYKVMQGEAPEGLFGDVNGDGSVNVTDVNLLVSAALNGTCPEGYDLNDDNTINVTDINLCVSAVLNQ